MKRLTLLTILLVLTLVLAACGGADPTPTPAPEPTEAALAEPTEEPIEEPTDEPMEEEMASNTIVDIAVADGRFTTLVAAVEAAGLAETLSGSGPFTVFAPTDDAFAALPEGMVEALLEDPSGDLTDILLYHVVEGEVLAADVAGLESAMTLLGEDIQIDAESDGVFLNEEAEVTITDIQADNGVIHVIDAVLLPPSEEEMMDMGSIVDVAVADGNFTTLIAAVEAAGLAETLSGEGPFTVFAPTDDAFAALPQGTVEALLEDPEGALTDILLYHVVEGAVPASDVVSLDSATTLLGENITIEVIGEDVVLNGSAEVIITDIETNNGIIHVIDAVLLPPEELASIAEIAVEDGNFTTLVAALEAAGLVETLSGAGEFTVFAPTDEAFAALPEGTVESLLEDPEGALTEILLYHVVDGIFLAEDVVTLESATTLQGLDITITVTDDGVILNDTVMVIITDIQASNGVIHVINAVLLPPEG
jgi:uncharacterized surface protein with fasciclin (FAS1) repeats